MRSSKFVLEVSFNSGTLALGKQSSLQESTHECSPAQEPSLVLGLFRPELFNPVPKNQIQGQDSSPKKPPGVPSRVLIKSLYLCEYSGPRNPNRYHLRERPSLRSCFACESNSMPHPALKEFRLFPRIESGSSLQL